jgi:hypothetical protein
MSASLGGKPISRIQSHGRQIQKQKCSVIPNIYTDEGGNKKDMDYTVTESVFINLDKDRIADEQVKNSSNHKYPLEPVMISLPTSSTSCLVTKKEHRYHKTMISTSYYLSNTNSTIVVLWKTYSMVTLPKMSS